MSGSNSSLPIYTIVVGTANTFTNDSTIDISSQLNSEIAAAPIGHQIVVDFEPGDYGVASPILLPSNTLAEGHNATLTYLATTANAGLNFALVANKDAYRVNNKTFVTTTSGQIVTLNTNDGPPSTSGTPTVSSPNDVIDTNISVQGLTFSLGFGLTFGSWFTNATDIDVQNNTYVGGMDGNANVDVVNANVSQNIAIGQDNAAYDNWNGPTNISVDDNATYTSGGWSVLVNSTPTGNTNNPGNAVNDSVVNNQLASGFANALALFPSALTSYGPTSESDVTIQGNIDSMMSIPGQQMVVSNGPNSNLNIQDNVVSGINSPSSSPTINVASNNLYSADSPNISGNLLVGSTIATVGWVISNNGVSPTTDNNSIINAEGESTDLSVSPDIQILSPAEFIAGPGSYLGTSTLSIIDASPDDSLSVTLSTHFGTLSTSMPLSGVTETSFNGETGLVLTGSISQINLDLDQLNLTTNSLGYDDSLEIAVSNESGTSAVRYVPIITPETNNGSSSILTLSSADLSRLHLGTHVTNAGLTGGAIIAASGNNNFSIDSVTSFAFLGAGDNVVNASVNPAYIVAGSGQANIELTGGGDETVAGGAGSLYVNAALGDNLIEASSGATTIQAGSGNNMILGGLGNLAINAGSGKLLISTLPENGGSLTANLSTGDSTVYALSGNDVIYNGTATDNTIYAGTCILNACGGSGAIIASGQGSYIGVAGTDWSVSADGDDSIASASDTAQISTKGTGNVVGLIGGSSTIAVGGSNDLVETFNSGVTGSISVSGSGDNILVDGGSDTVTAITGNSNLDVFFNVSGGSLDFINTSSSATTVSGAVSGAIGGSVTVSGGPGGGQFIGGPGGNNSLVGGTGLVTLYGAGTNNFLEANGAGTGTASNCLSVGTSGNSTLIASASTKDNTFYGGLIGSAVMQSSGSGVQNFFVGEGDQEQLTGSTVNGASNDYYFIQTSSGSGNDVITNFNPRTDKLFIDTIADQGDVSVASININYGAAGGSIIFLTNNTNIILYGISTSQLLAMGVKSGSTTI